MKKWGFDKFPSLAELKIAEETYGMTPDEYCKALNAAEEYEAQLEREGYDPERDDEEEAL